MSDISLDALADLTFAANDPQFQNPEAYDTDKWLDKLSDANEKIDEALDLLNEAIKDHETPALKRAGVKLLEAQTFVEAEL